MRACGRPLRRSRVIEIFQGPQQDETPTKVPKKYCLYEAQTSFALVGSDNKCWTAYGVVDTYYEPKHPEAIERHHRGSRKAGATRAPILPLGYDADRARFDARQYFLAVLDFRTGQVLREWDNLVQRIRDEVDR